MFEKLLMVTKDLFYWTINKIIQLLASFMDTIAPLLPDANGGGNYCVELMETPQALTGGSVVGASSSFGNILGWIAWVFPVDVMVNVLECLAAALLLYFTVGILMRWAKVS